MAFEEIKENAEHIQNEFHSYVENSLTYYKLKVFKLIMKSLMTIFKFTLLLAILLMVLFFGSIGLAFALSTYFESYIMGFSAVALGYFVIGLLFLLLNKKWIEVLLLKKFSNIFFNN
ncbi:competence protein [Flavobacterium sp. NG2]|uniref:competence protein n=1 Tax=Flavobacterium sp. NG2 TaxID=3097547 RepID=UPI002A80017F|nr:competence protein [Flavobacterium sp. NG2]WPR72246.1 competence protein [Flavobacterium sp. NG2]